MICMSRRRRRISESGGGKQVATFEHDAPGGGLDQAQDQSAQGALARTRFADQAQSLAGIDIEGDIVNRTNFALALPPKTDSPRGKTLVRLRISSSGIG